MQARCRLNYYALFWSGAYPHRRDPASNPNLQAKKHPRMEPRVSQGLNRVRSACSLPGRGQASAAIFSALARASSSVPTYMNADSGRSSASPSHSRLNESIVSFSGVVMPGKPVNTSAT